MPHAVSWVLEYETGHPVSAMDLGFNTHFHKTPVGEPFSAAGPLLIDDVIRTVNKDGYCSEGRAISHRNRPQYPKNILEAYTESSRDPALRQELFPGTSSREPIRYEHLWSDIRKQIDHNCQPRQHLADELGFQLHHSSRASGRDLFVSLDNDKPSVVTFLNSKLFNQENWPGAHAAVLVGRRWNDKTGECDYMIRDTGGTDCKNFRGTLIESQFRCENGNVIFGERRLSDAVHDTVELTFTPRPQRARPMNMPAIPGIVLQAAGQK